MSKRSILNTTSRKKRNDMLTYSNTSSDGTIQTTSSKQPLNVRGNSTFFSVWCPTAQNMNRDGGLNTINDIAARTSTTCYMRGLSEKIRIQTSTALPWFHRRICFTTSDQTWVRGALGPPVNGTTPVQENYLDVQGEGMQRTYYNLSDQSPTATLFNSYQDTLFKGVRNTDWNDFMTAKVDTTRVNLKFDRTRTIISGNGVGTVKTMNFWHPMNKNLYYDDDQIGERYDSNYWSAETNRGMGNYIVVDIIQGGAGGAVGDLYRLSAEATLYWHEK